MAPSLNDQFESATTLYKQKKFSDSKILFEKLIGEGHQVAQSHYYLGLIDLGSKNLDAAQNHFSTSSVLDPTNYHTLYFLAETFALKGSNDLAFFYYKKTLEINPNHRLAKDKLEALTGTSIVQPPSPTQSTTPSSGNINIKLDEKPESIKQDVIPPVRNEDYRGDLYDLLVEAKDATSKAAVNLIDKTRMINRQLRVTAHLGFLSFLFIVYLIIGVPFLAIIVEDPRVFKKEMAGFLGYFLTPPLILLILYLILYIVVKSTVVTIDRGMIQITHGVFVKRTKIFNIHTITAFETRQSFFNQITGDGGLIFTDPVSSGSRQGEKIFLLGLAKHKDLKQLAEDLRSLHYQLRGSNVIKGGLFG